MVQATEMGAIICPPSPGFYTRPATLEELIDHTVARLIDVIGLTLDEPLSSRWTGPDRARPAAGDEHESAT
jgi:4-hydroxy-3-polyprenylbenzoate decarboxylase